MFAGKLFASAALLAALAAPMAAQAGDAKVITTISTGAAAQAGIGAKALPSKLYLVDVDTSDCFEGGVTGSAASDFAANCSTLISMMPEARLIPSLRGRVEKALCPRVESVGEDGKKTSTKVCRTELTVSKINSLNNYQIVGLAYQLQILR